MKHKIIFVAIIYFCFCSCTKFRSIGLKNSNDYTHPISGVISFGSLRINEFICKGVNTKAQQYFEGSDAKWFELFNPTDKDITLTAGKWFLTDSLEEPTKYKIPQNTKGEQWTVPSNGYLAVMCLKSTSIPAPSKINASFSLSSTDGSIGIFYQNDSSALLIPIDTIRYSFPGGALSGISYGRTPNGIGPVFQLSDVTPEASN